MNHQHSANNNISSALGESLLEGSKALHDTEIEPDPNPPAASFTDPDKSK